jgi:arylsulfatase A-like enzyme
MVDRLFTWIDQDASHATPFFALCWTNQTHHPYAMTPGATEMNMLGDFNPPPPAKRDDINRYLNILAEEDRQIERLLTGLRQRGLADDTLVVFTGDHGEGFNWPHESFGHGFRLYEENLHVPCIFWNPRLFAGEKRLPAVGNHIDLAPTITDILGFTPAGAWQGHSLFDPSRPNRAYYYGAFDDYLLGAREGDWKYTYNATTGYGELYNLHDDPHEQTDVFADHPDLCKQLRDRAGAWARHMDQYGPGVKP